MNPLKFIMIYESSLVSKMSSLGIKPFKSLNLFFNSEASRGSNFVCKVSNLLIKTQLVPLAGVKHINLVTRYCDSVRIVLVES